jgi:hypothetical protein
MAPGESEEASYTPLHEREGIRTMSEHGDKIIKDLKIMAFNINSVRRRAQHSMEILRTEEPDILFLQETEVSDEKFQQTKNFNREILFSDRFRDWTRISGVFQGSEAAAWCRIVDQT